MLLNLPVWKFGCLDNNQTLSGTVRSPLSVPLTALLTCSLLLAPYCQSSLSSKCKLKLPSVPKLCCKSFQIIDTGFQGGEKGFHYTSSTPYMPPTIQTGFSMPNRIFTDLNSSLNLTEGIQSRHRFSRPGHQVAGCQRISQHRHNSFLEY